MSYCRTAGKVGDKGVGTDRLRDSPSFLNPAMAIRRTVENVSSHESPSLGLDTKDDVLVQRNVRRARCRGGHRWLQYGNTVGNTASRQIRPRSKVMNTRRWPELQRCKGPMLSWIVGTMATSQLCSRGHGGGRSSAHCRARSSPDGDGQADASEPLPALLARAGTLRLNQSRALT